MSGDGLTISFKTPTKREITVMAARLGLGRDDVLGKCVRLWLWAKANTVNGFASGVTALAVDHDLGCPGFAEALKEVGWLRIRNDGVEFPKYDRLASMPATADESGPAPTKVSERMRRYRDRKRNAGATDAQHERNASVTRKRNASVTEGVTQAQQTPETEKKPEKTDFFESPREGGVGGGVSSALDLVSSGKTEDKTNTPNPPTPLPEKSPSRHRVVFEPDPFTVEKKAAERVRDNYRAKVTSAYGFKGVHQITGLLRGGASESDLVTATDNAGAWYDREGVPQEKRPSCPTFFDSDDWRGYLEGIPPPVRGRGGGKGAKGRFDDI